jgi:glycosyltransferase involved in cell wall biosynthesis
MMKAFQHLAFLLPSLNSGGAERTILKLAIGFKERGFQVDLVLAHNSGPLSSEVPADLRKIDLHAPRAFTSRALSSLPSLTCYLRKDKPDILFTGLMTNLIAIWAKHLAASPTKIVISERNILSIEVKQFPRDIRFRLMPWFVRIFYPLADGIVAVSQAVADDLVKLTRQPAERIRIIYNPVITPSVIAKAEMPLSHPWFSAGLPPVILSVGRLVPQKDYPSLLRAFSIVRRTQPARLLILGEGGERKNLEQLATELGIKADVQFAGFVENPYPYMRNASLFVLSSEFEGLPGVLIEALFCGTPVIATDCPGGGQEVLANGKYGKLVPVRDPVTLAKAMQIYLANRPVPPPQASWVPYEQDRILDQYSDFFSAISVN